MRKVVFGLANLIYKLFCLLPINKNRMILECDYGKGFYGNLLYIYEEILNQNLEFQIIIPLNKGVTYDKKDNENTKIIRTKSIVHLYYLATSKYWITNNHYYFFLKPRSETIFINTWHALGAFKKFGLDSAKTKEEIDRFKSEGENIDYLLVSSTKLRDIYSKALNVDSKKILSLGIPRTDPLFNIEYKEKVRRDFFEKYPNIHKKKIILYAPTFRDHEKENFNLKLDLKKMKNDLGSDCILLLRLHPIIRKNYNLEKELQDFTIDARNENINDLMIISDILITDYSSLVFEYSLLKKTIIFYAYDYQEYANKIRGFYFEFKSFVPGDITKTTNEVISLIRDDKFDIERVEKFSETFCEFQDDKASKRFVDYFLKNIN
ncbi:CDP-glycerol glycerophosphotransferase family protein [Lutibacter sp. B2]|nr:CDP-glycerol glycerophosphotransferase family protein [Lutibacter sp. B2]